MAEEDSQPADSSPPVAEGDSQPTNSPPPPPLPVADSEGGSQPANSPLPIAEGDSQHADSLPPTAVEETSLLLPLVTKTDSPIFFLLPLSLIETNSVHVSLIPLHPSMMQLVVNQITGNGYCM